MRLVSMILLITSTLLGNGAAAQAPEADASAIREVIENAYVRGVFVDEDPAAVRAGFHPSFILSVHDADSVIVVPLERWLDVMDLSGEPTGDAVRHVFERVDVTGGAATVKMQIWINDVHVYTDYLSLYRFNDGWKIVLKIFESHD